MQSIKYKLHEVVFASILAILSGADSYSKTYVFAQENDQLLKKYFIITWKDPPVYTTIRNVLLLIYIEHAEKRIKFNLIKNQRFIKCFYTRI